MHDDLHERKSHTDDENRRGHLIKAITHLIRLSGIIHVMEMAFNAIASGTALTMDTWSKTIELASLERAWKVICYALDQKWALMPPTTDFVNPDTDDFFLEHNYRKIRKLLNRPGKDFPMTPSAAARHRLTPTGVDSKGNKIKNNSDTALAFFDKLQDLHFGKNKKEVAKNKKVTSRFSKRKYEELDAVALGHLKKLKMTKKQYEGEVSLADSDSDSDVESTPTKATTSTEPSSSKDTAEQV